MKIGYFPGCSLNGTGMEYGESLKKVCSSFGIELEEINDWNCCGATAAHSLNHLLSIALPARTLALAAKQGFKEILVPCAACYARLLSAWNEMRLDEAVRQKIQDVIELPYDSSVKPINVIDFIRKYVMPELSPLVKKPFANKVACYYGCLLVRPPQLMNFERYEDPIAMEEIMKAIGSKPIDWAFKTECCGAGLSVPRTDIVAKLSGKIIRDAVDRGAEAIIVACPMCQSNLDMRRKEINQYLQKETDIPILYITQAIGLSLGFEKNELGLQKHFVEINDLLLNKKIEETDKTTKPQVKKLEEVI